MATAIRTEGLTRDFRIGSSTVHALREVTVDLPESKLTIVRGRSGSGKTTLLNIIGLLDRPGSGTLHYGQVDALKMSDAERDRFRRREIGFVYQNIALVALMTARENVDFRLRLAGTGRAQREETVERSLKLVGLEKRMDHRPAAMSGGEQQRVAIARAIAHRPRVLFADEPTGQLDTATGLRIVSIFRRLVEQEGLTIVMTTHDPAMLDLADQVVELESGRVAVGQP